MPNIQGFFAAVLPVMLQWKGPAAAAVNATVRFVISGTGGGTWTLRLLPPESAVIAGATDSADLIIFATVDEMAALLAGTSDIRRALADGTIMLEGDLQVLRRLRWLFGAGGTSVETRCAESAEPRSSAA